MIAIKHRFTNTTLCEFNVKTVKDAVIKAVESKTNLSGADLYGADLSGADLRGANLSGANLSGADLSGADLSGADLSGANLSGANLCEVNLYGVNLRGANLREANLCEVNLRGANLSGANLYRANLRGANLSGANLYRANLREANLRGADLSGANLYEAKNGDLVKAQTVIVPEGDIIGWKKCLDNVIVKLLIPKEAKRSNATGRKCRAEYVEVLDLIYGNDKRKKVEKAISSHDKKTEYKKGETVKCDKWDEERFNECSGGIHFFITREEAEDYNI